MQEVGIDGDRLTGYGFGCFERQRLHQPNVGSLAIRVEIAIDDPNPAARLLPAAAVLPGT